MKKEKVASVMLRGLAGVVLASLFIIAVMFWLYIMLSQVIPASLLLMVSMTGVAPNDTVMNTVFVLGMPSLFLIGLYLIGTVKAISYVYQLVKSYHKRFSAYIARHLIRSSIKKGV